MTPILPPNARLPPYSTGAPNTDDKSSAQPHQRHLTFFKVHKGFPSQPSLLVQSALWLRICLELRVQQAPHSFAIRGIRYIPTSRIRKAQTPVFVAPTSPTRTMEFLFSTSIEPKTAAIVATTVVATLSFLSLARLGLYPNWGTAIPNPLKTKIPTLASDEVKKLPYHPDYFPGARDVDTPYGSIRVYEWGSTTGPKVVLIHGISTSCMTLGPISHALAARGCRVMLFDLFGRGFSDGVGDLPHDTRLYTTQVLLALASSPLAWSGTDAVRVVGYSLGGAVAASFAASFPHMVESLVLLAPAGLIRAENFGVLAQVTFQSGLVPERILAAVTRKRLQKPLASKRSNVVEDEEDPVEKVVDVAAAEVSGPHGNGEDQKVERKVREYVPWMVAHHEGFVKAFMSCVRWAPLTGQHQTWRVLGQRKKGTTAVFIGKTDEVIDVEHYAKDGLPLLGGEENVTWKVLPGGHDFVMTKTEYIMRELDVFWGMKVQS
ncbi:hypothetical protein CSIM01_10365 [Colletotrichum simmondsii]|uniref:Serine aminopeptidase S33 domain-containing protein n=1 Tax=Colletotrichum simmondsii TaxID=703756 RepID=A0A135TAS4_9PEZI|nr:hypothetical protein CSIM01_10365 [Colletotrichum simmondsii]